MKLPIPVDFQPMEARAVNHLPEGEGWQYEPKWDGFRCLAFRDGSEVDLRSKSGQPLARYFPDIAERVAKLGRQRFVLDGELVIDVRVASILKSCSFACIPRKAASPSSRQRIPRVTSSSTCWSSAGAASSKCHCQNAANDLNFSSTLCTRRRSFYRPPLKTSP
jgi:hypothetical protein